MKEDRLRELKRSDSAILSYWGENEAEWARFSDIWKHAKEKSEVFKGKSGKVRFVRRLNGLREKDILEKRVLEDRSTQYRLNGLSVFHSVIGETVDSTVTIITDEIMNHKEREELEIGLKEAIEAIQRHLPLRGSISRLVMEWRF